MRGTLTRRDGADNTTTSARRGGRLLAAGWLSTPRRVQVRGPMNRQLSDPRHAASRRASSREMRRERATRRRPTATFAVSHQKRDDGDGAV